MERPGLKALLADIDAGLIDVIVVYKVDRLTRSLADFAKIVERLDAKQASFVSVTQAFNTTTSMGRLTLNVLLSFAQFEREVTGERIRDKIAASKKKGLWMGGPVPLGYQVVARELVPVPEEAERVRTIMQRYLEVRNVPWLIEILRTEGNVTKVQQRASGPHRGGIPFARGSLFHMLKNPIYRGMIVHKGKVYQGEHEAIVDSGLWDAVQSQLKAKAPPRKRSGNDAQRALLAGLLSDPEGRQVVPTYSAKNNRRYAYYESRKDLARPGDPPATRIGQGALDNHVLGHLHDLLQDEHTLRRLSGLEDAAPFASLFEAASALRSKLDRMGERQGSLRKLIALISIEQARLVLTLKPAALGLADQPCWTWSIASLGRKPFREVKLRLDCESGVSFPDQQLLKLLAEAREAQELVLGSPGTSINQIAKATGRCRKQLTKLFNVSWLSPRIVDAIVEGKQPHRLSRSRLLEADLPLDWSEQERLLGFAA